MKVVRAAFSRNRNCGARAPAEFRRVWVRNNLEFFDRINGLVDGLGAQLLNVFGKRIVIDSVEKKIVLQRPHAVNIDAASTSGGCRAALLGITITCDSRDHLQ